MRERSKIFGLGGGFVLNAVHNVQALTPLEDLIALPGRGGAGRRSLPAVIPRERHVARLRSITHYPYPFHVIILTGQKDSRGGLAPGEWRESVYDCDKTALCRTVA